jgi:hypothetical protein
MCMLSSIGSKFKFPIYFWLAKLSTCSRISPRFRQGAVCKVGSARLAEGKPGARGEVGDFPGRPATNERLVARRRIGFWRRPSLDDQLSRFR